MKIFKSSIWLTIVCLLSACDNAANDYSPATQAQPEKTISDVAGDVLATIDGVEVTKSQLDMLLINMFGKYRAMQMDSDSRQRALNSVLASYALSKEAVKELPVEKVGFIEEKTRVYRENLLINAYMQTKMNADALSNEKIKQYYEKNIESFGGKTIKEYQLLTTREELAEESWDEYMAIIAANKNKGNLQTIKQQLEKKKFEVQLHAGVLNKDLFNVRLYQFIDSQAINKISEISFIDGKPYLVEITNEKKLKAKPLAEVRDNIRKTLVLQQLKKTIKEQSAKALANSKIVYRNR